MQFASLNEAQHRDRNMSTNPNVFWDSLPRMVLPDLRRESRPRTRPVPKTEPTESKTKSTTEAKTEPKTMCKNESTQTNNEITEAEDHVQEDPQAERSTSSSKGHLELQPWTRQGLRMDERFVDYSKD